MRAFLLRRLLHELFVTWGVVTVVFFLVRLTGDPTLFLVDQSATQEEIAHTRALLGLDRPLAVQYVDFLGSALRGDFGVSIRERSEEHTSELQSHLNLVCRLLLE